MSSKRRIRRNACTRKVRHATQEGARVAIKVMVKRMGGMLGYMQSYKCQFCGGWHIGHGQSKGWQA